MNWDDLRYFLAVAAAGSLSGAGQQLGVNTTTVLRRVGSLEDDLGTRLFERERTGYRLTPSGEKLAEALEPVDRRLAALPRDFVADDKGREAVVRLAAGDSIAAGIIAPEYPSFREQHPGLALDIVPDPRISAAGGGVPRIGNPMRDVDLALRLARPTQGDMLMRKLGDMGFGLYASPGYLAARGTPQQMGQMSDHDVIGFSEGETPIGPVWWLSRAEKPAHVVMRAASDMARAEAAREGMGLAALPCIMAEGDGRLTRVFGPEIIGALEIWLMARNDLAQLAHIRAVMAFMVEAVKQRRGRLEGRLHDVTELPAPQRANP
ncbi:MAG: LysR family transcriptional regulator [Rhizobiales bacterium]|nr:LysR family transcriptional regulator [Hyphomicrobiales bacterium]